MIGYKKLIILRGVSGSGKSTLARILTDAFNSLDDDTAYYCEADDYMYEKDAETGTTYYNWSPDKLKSAHEWCYSAIANAMVVGKETIILSNTSTKEKDFSRYINLAEENGYSVISLVVENRHGNDSIHGVSQQKREQQAKTLKQNIKLL